ncbi:hypothetical protein Tco_1142276 [Tanacetum coccineum]
MLLNVDQLQKQLDKDEFQEEGSMAAFWVRYTTPDNLGTVKKCPLLKEHVIKDKSIKTDSTLQDEKQQVREEIQMSEYAISDPFIRRANG